VQREDDNLPGGSTSSKRLGARFPFEVKNGKNASAPEDSLSERLAVNPMDYILVSNTVYTHSV
jgi:hypothetical protein